MGTKLICSTLAVMMGIYSLSFSETVLAVDVKDCPNAPDIKTAIPNIDELLTNVGSTRWKIFGEMDYGETGAWSLHVDNLQAKNKEAAKKEALIALNTIRDKDVLVKDNSSTNAYAFECRYHSTQNKHAVITAIYVVDTF